MFYSTVEKLRVPASGSVVVTPPLSVLSSQIFLNNGLLLAQASGASPTTTLDISPLVGGFGGNIVMRTNQTVLSLSLVPPSLSHSSPLGFDVWGILWCWNHQSWCTSSLVWWCPCQSHSSCEYQFKLWVPVRWVFGIVLRWYLLQCDRCLKIAHPIFTLHSCVHGYVLDDRR